MDRVRIGARVKALRVLAGLPTQSALAQAVATAVAEEKVPAHAACSQQMLAYLEAGTRFTSLATLQAVAEVTGATVEVVLGDAATVDAAVVLVEGLAVEDAELVTRLIRALDADDSPGLRAALGGLCSVVEMAATASDIAVKA